MCFVAGLTVFVDKRITLGAFKLKLEPFVQVQAENFKVLIKIQVNLIITLSLKSMETDRVVSELCYNEVIYNTHIAKLSFWEP